MDIGLVVGHSVLPAVKVVPVGRVKRCGTNGCTLWWAELC